jgi:hypothetical protein
LLAAVVFGSVKHFGANLFYRYNQDSTQHLSAIFSSGSPVRSAYFFSSVGNLFGKILGMI